MTTDRLEFRAELSRDEREQEMLDFIARKDAQDAEEYNARFGDEQAEATDAAQAKENWEKAEDQRITQVMGIAWTRGVRETELDPANPDWDDATMESHDEEDSHIGWVEDKLQDVTDEVFNNSDYNAPFYDFRIDPGIQARMDTGLERLQDRITYAAAIMVGGEHAAYGPPDRVDQAAELWRKILTAGQGSQPIQFNEVHKKDGEHAERFKNLDGEYYIDIDEERESLIFQYHFPALQESGEALAVPSQWLQASVADQLISYTADNWNQEQRGEGHLFSPADLVEAHNCADEIVFIVNNWRNTPENPLNQVETDVLLLTAIEVKDKTNELLDATTAPTAAELEEYIATRETLTRLLGRRGQRRIASPE